LYRLYVINFNNEAATDCRTL